MANLSLGDKILSPVSSRTTGRPGERGSATETRSAASPRNDAPAGIDSPSEAARPLSHNIGGSRQALHVLAQLKAQLEERPQEAIKAHAGIRPEQARALTHALDVNG